MAAEAEKLRDMILTKEGENNQLKDKITSLQEDIDTVSPFISPVRGRSVFTDLTSSFAFRGSLQAKDRPFILQLQNLKKTCLRQGRHNTILSRRNWRLNS
jgi:hypothetical protein